MLRKYNLRQYSAPCFWLSSYFQFFYPLLIRLFFFFPKVRLVPVTSVQWPCWLTSRSSKWTRRILRKLNVTRDKCFLFFKSQVTGAIRVDVRETENNKKKSYARTQKEKRKTTYFGVGTTEPNFQENYKTVRKKIIQKGLIVCWWIFSIRTSWCQNLWKTTSLWWLLVMNWWRRWLKRE